MTRIQADLCLALTALIWGAAFLAQKTALDHIGPFTFVALRFALSALCVMPLAVLEQRRSKSRATASKPAHHLGWKIAILCLGMAGGVLLQQYALVYTSITNGGMLTGLYVVWVPIILTVFFGRRMRRAAWLAALLSIAGSWLLTVNDVSTMGHGQGLESGLGRGDLILLVTGFVFAFQVVLLGIVLESVRRPLGLCLLQYTFVTVVATILAALFESVPLATLIDGIVASLPAVLFAGIVSGGIAYTLQAIAQQYTPSSDAAIIMGAEGMIATLCGILFLDEAFTQRIAVGCLLIVLAVLIVEAGPGLRRILLRRTTN